tara:strand:- start:715 stop:1314 length:600 start_codon:yes stop_codon:yes gene_type:complete
MINFENLVIDEVSFGSLNKKIYTFVELQNLLNLKPFLNTDRFYSLSNQENLMWDNSSWSTTNHCWPIELVENFVKNSTCFITECSRVNKQINEIADKLEKKFYKSVDCHLYFSLNKEYKNFGRHSDQNHNLIVVCEGQILVEVFSKEHHSKKLSEGDFVFIPAGVDHKINSLSNKRLSASFCVTQDDCFIDNRDWLEIT